MGFYMDESDEGPAIGGIARDLVPKQEAKKNALVALVTDVEQRGGPEVSQTHRHAGSSLASGSVAHDGVLRFTDTLEVRWPLAASHTMGST